MATATSSSGIEEIGETAGEVWHLLAEQGRISLPQLVKEVDTHRDLVMQAIGWLAREDKVLIEETARSRIIMLR